jgi:Rha family phage regulatory protein
MNDLAPIDPQVFLENGRAFTTSLNVASVFGKLHKNVLRDIERMECSNEFRRLNFEPANYSDAQGKPRDMVEITRDGFTFLVMGYTGQSAAQFKEAYIARFNQLQEQLVSGTLTRAPFHQQKVELAARYDKARGEYAKQAIHEAMADLHLAHGKTLSEDLRRFHRQQLHDEPAIAAHFWDIYEQSGADAEINHSADQGLVAINIKQAMHYLTGQSVSLPARAELMRCLMQSRRYRYLCQKSIHSRLLRDGKPQNVYCWLFRKPAAKAKTLPVASRLQ